MSISCFLFITEFFIYSICNFIEINVLLEKCQNVWVPLSVGYTITFMPNN